MRCGSGAEKGGGGGGHVEAFSALGSGDANSSLHCRRSLGLGRLTFSQYKRSAGSCLMQDSRPTSIPLCM